MTNKETILQFPGILELVDFTIAAKTVSYEINRTALTLRGEFSDQDIELALRGFKAAGIHEGLSKARETS